MTYRKGWGSMWPEGDGIENDPGFEPEFEKVIVEGFGGITGDTFGIDGMGTVI